MTKLIDLSELNATEIVKKYRTFTTLAATVLIGVLVGAWAISLSEANAFFGIDSIINYFTTTAKDQTFFETFLYSLLKYLPLLVFFYILGTCSFGSVFVYLAIFLQGFSVGTVSGYFYSHHELTGIGLFTLVILPGTFIYLFSLLLAGRDSIKISVNYFKLLIPNTQIQSFSQLFKKYSVNYGFYFFVSVFASLIDALMQSAFMRYFNF